MSRDDWMEYWQGEKYSKGKIAQIELLDGYLKDAPPKTIIDIGCGYAHESEYFHKKYGSKLYLLDGDKDKNKEEQNRQINWGPSSNLQWYNSKKELGESFKQRKIEYTFIDLSRGETLPDDLKVDMIWSFASCGAHYPVTDYKELIAKHSDENTRFIFDLRDLPAFKAIEDHMKDMDIVHVLLKGTKHQLCEVKPKWI